MNRSLIIIVSLFVTGCAVKPPIYNSNKAIIADGTPYPQADAELAAWLDKSQSMSLDHRGDTYTKLRTFDSALGTKCQRVRVQSHGHRQNDLFACQHDSGWVIVLNENSTEKS